MTEATSLILLRTRKVSRNCLKHQILRFLSPPQTPVQYLSKKSQGQKLKTIPGQAEVSAQ